MSAEESDRSSDHRLSLPALLRRPSLVAVNRPTHGLGNRLRSVLGAESLAVVEGRRFAYCWPVGSAFGAHMADLWDYRPPTVGPATVRALSARYPLRDHTAEWRPAERRRRVWQIRTAQPLELPPDAVPWTDRLRALTPTDEIAGRITGWFDQHLAGRPYVGVMVRAHDVSHAESRRHSPVEWFVTRMQEIRAARPDVGFFLSCDVPEVQDDIIRRVPGTTGQVDKGPYNSAAALKSATVDLYLLAASAHLLAPHYSSFPELAAYLADGRVALETSRTEPSSAFEQQTAVTVVRDPLRPAVSG